MHLFVRLGFYKRYTTVSKPPPKISVPKATEKSSKRTAKRYEWSLLPGFSTAHSKFVQWRAVCFTVGNARHAVAESIILNLSSGRCSFYTSAFQRLQKPSCAPKEQLYLRRCGLLQQATKLFKQRRTTHKKPAAEESLQQALFGVVLFLKVFSFSKTLSKEY